MLAKSLALFYPNSVSYLRRKMVKVKMDPFAVRPAASALLDFYCHGT
jgi:hypothetical protein